MVQKQNIMANLQQPRITLRHNIASGTYISADKINVTRGAREKSEVKEWGKPLLEKGFRHL